MSQTGGYNKDLSDSKSFRKEKKKIKYRTSLRIIALGIYAFIIFLTTFVLLMRYCI